MSRNSCDNQAFKNGRIAGANGGKRNPGPAQQKPTPAGLAKRAEWFRGYDVGRATLPIGARTKRATKR